MQKGVIGRVFKDFLTKHKSYTKNTSSKLHVQELFAAALAGNLSKVQLIINKKAAGVNSTDQYMWTPLHIFSSIGHTEAVKFLLKEGANPNAAEYNSYTPLHLAFHYGHTNCVKALLDGGGDTNALTKAKLKPLDLAAQKGHNDCIEAALSNSSVSSESMSTALFFAAKNMHEKAVNTLIKNGARVNYKDYCVDSLVHLFAVYAGCGTAASLVLTALEASPKDIIFYNSAIIAPNFALMLLSLCSDPYKVYKNIKIYEKRLQKNSPKRLV